MELDFLLDKREFTKPQKWHIRCRLMKKVKPSLTVSFISWLKVDIILLRWSTRTMAALLHHIAAVLQPAAICGISWLGYRYRHRIMMREEVKRSGPKGIRTLDPRHVKA
jgi:hypothetical protein